MDFYIDMTECSPEDREYLIACLHEHGAPTPINNQRFLQCIYWVFRRINRRYMLLYSNDFEPPRNAVPIDEALDRETG